MEINRIESWITSTLQNDAALTAAAPGGVHAWPVLDEEKVFPVVVFEYQPGSEDVNGVGARRIMVSAVYLVRVIGRECGIEDLKTAADRMDTLLTAAIETPASPGVTPGTNTPGVMGCYREQPFSMVEVDEGVRYPHLGGLYRILAN